MHDTKIIYEKKIYSKFKRDQLRSLLIIFQNPYSNSTLQNYLMLGFVVVSKNSYDYLEDNFKGSFLIQLYTFRRWLFFIYFKQSNIV